MDAGFTEVLALKLVRNRVNVKVNAIPTAAPIKYQPTIVCIIRSSQGIMPEGPERGATRAPGIRRGRIRTNIVIAKAKVKDNFFISIFMLSVSVTRVLFIYFPLSFQWISPS